MKTISIIGLGYVGLPLAVEFGKKRPVIGFDINLKRVKELANAIDTTLEVQPNELKEASKLKFTNQVAEIKDSQIYIITVPTPVNEQNKPDLGILVSATEIVGSVLKENDIVIYESTVYPGATEEVCVPILERESGLIFNQGFFCGYSPERINPGDKHHRLTNIIKVTSGSTPEVALEIDKLYGSIIKAGTYPAESIKVAEAAKIIENSQRDVNIALINELAIIFNKLGIDTLNVLKAAETKWNFLSFRPGLVGGHCIGVDPYYLTYKAEELGYTPKILLAGRGVNNSMSKFIIDQVIGLMNEKHIKVQGSYVLIMGFTFKENCPDVRNTKVIDLKDNLNILGAKVDVYDPIADKEETNSNYGINLIDSPESSKYDAIILAVAHNEFKALGLEKIRSYGRQLSVIYDAKHILNIDESDGRL